MDEMKMTRRLDPKLLLMAKGSKQDDNVRPTQLGTDNGDGTAASNTNPLKAASKLVPKTFKSPDYRPATARHLSEIKMGPSCSTKRMDLISTPLGLENFFNRPDPLRPVCLKYIVQNVRQWRGMRRELKQQAQETEDLECSSPDDSFSTCSSVTSSVLNNVIEESSEASESSCIEDEATALSDVEDDRQEKPYPHALAATFKATLQPNTAPPQSSDGSMSQNLGSGRTVHRSSQLKREVHVRTYVNKKTAAKRISSFGRNSVMKTSAAAAAVRSTAAATATVTSSSAATSSAEFVAADSSGPITAVPEATPPAPKRPPLHRQPERRETIPRFSLDSDEEDDGGLERYGERPPKLPRIHVDEPTDDIVLTGPSTMPSNLQVSQISHGSTAIEDAKQLKSAVKLGSSIKVVGQLKGITGHVVHVEANEVVVLSHLSTQECVVPLSDLSSNSSLRLQCEEELVTLDSQSSSLSGNPSCGPSQPSMPAPREHGAGTQVTLQHPTKALGKDSSAPTRNMAGVSVGGSLRPALQQLEPTTLHAQSSSTARLSTSRPDAAQVPGSKPPQPLIVSHSLWGGPRQKASQNPPRPQKGGRHQGREKAVGSIREDATPTKFTSQKSTEASKKPQSVAVDIEVEAPLPAKKMHVAKPGGSRDHQVQKTGLQSLAASDNPSSGASQQSKHAPSEQRTLEPTLVLTKLPERIVHYWEAKHDFKEHTRENGNRKENNAHLADDAFFARIRDRQASTQQMFEFLSEKKKQELSRSEKAVLLEENRLRSLEKYILEDGYNKCISATKKGLFLDGVRNRFRQNTYLRVPINAYNLLYKHYFH